MKFKIGDRVKIKDYPNKKSYDIANQIVKGYGFQSFLKYLYLPYKNINFTITACHKNSFINNHSYYILKKEEIVDSAWDFQLEKANILPDKIKALKELMK
jgi:hypothetical protein